MSLTTVNFKVSNHLRERRNVEEDELSEIFSKKRIQKIHSSRSEFEILFHDGSRIVILPENYSSMESILDIEVSVEL